MKLVIELGEDVSDSAELQIREIAHACETHDVCFSSDSIEIRRGDSTCVAEGGGHRSAAELFSLVQRVSLEDTPFKFDSDNQKLVPLACGAYVAIN